MKPNPTETLEDRLAAFDDLEGNDPEIHNLEELVSAAFALLTPEQRTTVLAENPLDPDFRF